MKKKLLIFPLIALLSFTFACSGESNTKFEEYYDSSWIQGENAITNNIPSIKNPKGECTIINELRRSQNNIGLPTKGDANILVVPIDFLGDFANQIFTNVDVTYTDKDLSNIEKTYFADISNNIFPSVKSFYKASSFNKLNLNGVVSPVVTLPKEYKDYLSKAHAVSINEAVNEIISYVYDYLFNETKTYYIGDFDSDNDKKVDAISLICNYPINISFGDAYLDATHRSLVDYKNVYFSSSITDIENTPINAFSIASDAYRFASNSGRDSHAFIYQVGRMLGLDDYEDLTGNVYTSYYRAPLGYMDIMGGLVGDHNVFSKYQLGWIEPRVITLDDIPDNGLTLTLNSSITSGDAIILSTSNKGLFGEYLMLDLYTLEGVNEIDKEMISPYGLSLFDKAGIRLYQVDSSLVRGYDSIYTKYNGELDFDAIYVLENGEEVAYVYDYAYSNNSSIKYPTSGEIYNYPLVSLLSKKGVNRHLVDYSNYLTSSDLFLEGDSFATESQIEGFYRNFAFHNEEKLGISFNVDKIENNTATITFRRVK